MFEKIKEWKIGDDIITLWLQTTDYSGIKQLFLNRQRKRTGFTNERGVEIPFEKANELALYLMAQISSDKSYVKGTCDEKDIEKKGDYTFESIKKFILNDGRVINLKLMYNDKETKLFLNRQVGVAPTGNEGGVEIPYTLVQEIALTIRQSIKK